MPQKIPTSQTQPVYTDLDPSMTRNPKTNDWLSLKDSRSIKSSLQNLFSTSYGERLFQPQIGNSLRSLLFEPIDSITTFEVRDRILETIRKYEPRISNVIVDVVANPNQNQYEVTVEYTIQALGAADKVTTVLERIR